MVELREWEVVGLIPGLAIPKALKMVPVATLLGAQHCKASPGFSSNKYYHHITRKKVCSVYIRGPFER